MPRSKLTPLPEYSFRYHTTIKIRDINYGNHLGNDAVVGLLHEARIDLFNQIGVAELDLGDRKTGIVIADLVVNYKDQGYLGDEIVISSHLGEFGQKSFRIFYRITRGQELLVLAETGIVVFDYTNEKIGTIPDSFHKALNNYQEK